jgi:hypothetical protein
MMMSSMLVVMVFLLMKISFTVRFMTFSERTIGTLLVFTDSHRPIRQEAHP